MTPKEVLEHNWQIGEKVWIVCEEQVLDGPLKGKYKPVKIEEVSVLQIKPDNRWPDTYKYIEVLFDWKSIGVDPESCPPYPYSYHSLVLAAMVEYNKYGDDYIHNEFCLNKFFNKQDAEKRFKECIESWNKRVKAKIETVNRAFERAKNEFENAKENKEYNFDKYLIK